MDPNDSRVLYTGFDKLYRTDDSAESWAPITPVLRNVRTNITAIAIAPSDSNTVYVGLQDGSVFRVRFANNSWQASDRTVLVLPAGQVSDIAVHPTDPETVYVTTSNLIASEGVGEFTNDHVFKTTNGGGTWQSASRALSRENPVNTVVLDPDRPETVFIGADIGVFRSDDGGGSWRPWDEGLPNCSVQSLNVFGPRRLLRAATHGRSIWERPLNPEDCPVTDVYVRTSPVDTGLELPAATGGPHPFIPTMTIHWSQAPDVKIARPNTVESELDYLKFEELPLINLRRGETFRIFVQVHNRGSFPATRIRVRAFWADVSVTAPNLPTDFWNVFPDADPQEGSWNSLGPAQDLAELHPARPGIVSWDWDVPAGSPADVAILCAVTSEQDDVAGTTLDLEDAVRGDNNVALKAFHVAT